MPVGRVLEICEFSPMHRMLEKVDNQDCSVYDETPAEAWHHAFLTHFNLFYSFISSYFD